MKFDKKIWASKDFMTKTRVNAWIMKISTLFIALQPRLVVTLNIKPIYISKNSNKNVLKKHSIAKLYSLFHGLHLLFADYVVSLFFVCNSCHVA